MRSENEFGAGKNDCKARKYQVDGIFH